MTNFAPELGELCGIQNGLRGWEPVDGLGPNYFISPTGQKQLRDLFMGVTPTDTSALETELLVGRARVVNFFALVSGEGDFVPHQPAAFRKDVDLFIAQWREQAKIWTSGGFKAFGFSPAEMQILAEVASRASPVLFIMGFPDSVHHSHQVSRLCANMAQVLNGRSSEVLQAAIVGMLHDPKFHPQQDITKQNLATHPMNAAALAHAIFEDVAIQELLFAYFKHNRRLRKNFVRGVVHALAVNNDSAFVQLNVILPQFVKRIGEKHGAEVAAGFKSVLEGRLASPSKRKRPPRLPKHLHGALAQELLDSGLRGITRNGWCEALRQAGVVSPIPFMFFDLLIAGTYTNVDQTKVAAVRASLSSNPNAILKALISATRMLHHHDEVIESGRIAASALVIADPLLLSPHKIAAVYNNCTIAERVKVFCGSFDDNIRLLPQGAHKIGKVWQRAVLISLLEASDRLTASHRVAQFEESHRLAGIEQDIADLMAEVLTVKTWGEWAQETGPASANPKVGQAISALEAGYLSVINGYRQATYEGADETKFFPKR